VSVRSHGRGRGGKSRLREALTATATANIVAAAGHLLSSTTPHAHGVMGPPSLPAEPSTLWSC
jgi:hypothetical protein